MNKKHLLAAVLLTVTSLGIAGINRDRMAAAQEAGEAGAGGIGGAGGRGGIGGAGGSGGGSGGFAAGEGGGVAAHGEYVYVLRNSVLYQYAAYDLKFVKKISLNASRAEGRSARGGRGGRGGRDGDAGQDGEDGQPGGASFRTRSGGGVAAYGDFVYVLQGSQLRKFSVDDLAPVKAVKVETGDENAKQVLAE